jgi:transposase
MARPISLIKLTEPEEKELKRRINASSISKRDSLRAEIILNLANGKKQKEVAKDLGISVPSVNKWSQRFERYRLEGLVDKPGRGRKPTIPLEIIEQVIIKVTKPPKGRTRWSSRSMADVVGISARSVRKIWKANGLKPHLTKIFKVSNDPRFKEKFWDVIGLYLNPPEKALILCCDEKSQCQALERSQPGLPLGIGHIRTKTHDYKRHGTITLFAALNYLEGNIIARKEKHHTHNEWLRFLKQINREVPGDIDIHIIADNYSTHKHKEVRRWIKNHSRFHMHFTPTSSSWMNMVERFFAEITRNVIRDGSFESIRELVNAIDDYLKQHNSAPKPYKWKAKGEDILKKIQRARQTLSTVKEQQHG